MDIVLEAKNLTKVYGSGEGTVHALRGVSVGIERGSFTAIIGKSGCGKSTLLQALGGLDAPTSGQVLLEGQSLYDLPDDELAWLRRTKLGFVFQAFNLLPEYTIRDNILLPLMLDKKAVDEAYLKFLTERLGLADLLAPPARSAFGRTAAARCHCSGADCSPGGGTGGRTHR